MSTYYVHSTLEIEKKVFSGTNSNTFQYSRMKRISSHKAVYEYLARDVIGESLLNNQVLIRRVQARGR